MLRDRDDNCVDSCLHLHPSPLPVGDYVEPDDEAGLDPDNYIIEYNVAAIDREEAEPLEEADNKMVK